MHVGFVGLGNIGAPMARAVLRAGFELTVQDLSDERVQACVAEGAHAGDVSSCEVVCVAVPDDTAVLEVVDGLTQTVVVHSTILPATARSLGANVLDAPVSGGADRALEGDLTVMVGGDAE